MPPPYDEWQAWACTLACGGAILWYWLILFWRRR